MLIFWKTPIYIVLSDNEEKKINTLWGCLDSALLALPVEQVLDVLYLKLCIFKALDLPRVVYITGPNMK